MSPHPLIRQLPFSVALLATVAYAPLRAQCSDPATPVSGFLVTEQLDQLVTFGDASKTRADVRYPATPAGTCGWPVIVLVHGYSGSRKDLATACRQWTRSGYMTVAYDVRGQGESKTLNPASVGSAFVGKEERLDLAEIIRWVGTSYGGTPKLADSTRIAVMGPSQGGLHAWAAAAWSGKSLPSNSRSLTTFPTIHAACAQIFPAMHENVFVPGGTTFLNHLLEILWLNSTVRLDTSFQSSLQSYILAEDFNTLRGYFANDPWRQDRQKLANSSVPICVTVGWSDTWADMTHTLDALAALPTNTPRHLQMDAAGGHSMPSNDRQGAFSGLAQERWLGRFLKGVQNGIALEAPIQSCLLSADPLREADPTLLLWNRTYDTWPPANNVSRRFWLRAAQSLSATAPASAETGDAVQNQVLSGFNISQYITQAQLATAATFQKMPLDSRHFDSAPLTDDIEIAGQPRVEIEITTTDKTLMLHCALFQLAPGASERLLTDGVIAVRAAASAPTRLVVDMSPVQVRLPKGNQVRLRIENLPWRRSSQQDEFMITPCFGTYVVTVEHTAARPSFLDLPLRPLVMPAVTCASDTLYVATPNDLRYTIQAPANLVGSYYAFVFTTSGTAPVIQLPSPDPLRFLPDSTTSALFGAMPPFLYGGTSILNGLGEGYVLLAMRSFAPIPSAWAGARLSTTVLVINGSNLLPASPIDVIFR